MTEVQHKTARATYKLFPVAACCLLTLCILGLSASTGRTGTSIEMPAAAVEAAPAQRQAQSDTAIGVGHVNPPPPHVSRVRVTSGDTVVYDTQGNIRSEAKASNGAYDLKLSIWFSTLVATSRAAVTAGFHAPYDTYLLETKEDAGAIWDTFTDPDNPYAERTSVLETSISIPQAEVPDSSYLWFSLSSTSLAGLTLDTNPAAPGHQPNTRHFAVLDIDDYYLSTMSREWSMEGRSSEHPRFDGSPGATADHWRTWRPFEIQFRLVPQEPGYDDDPQRYLDQWNEAVAIVEHEMGRYELFRKEMRTRLSEWEDFLARLPPDYEVGSGIEAEIAQILSDLQLTESEIPIFEAALGAIAGAEEDFRHLIAFRRSYRKYLCDEDLTPPVLARFGGMDGESRHVNSAGRVDFRRYEAPGWTSPDLTTQFGWIYDNRCPRLSTIHIDVEELRLLSALVADLPVLTVGQSVGDDFLRIQMERLSETIREAAVSAVGVAWRFASSNEGVGELSIRSEQPVFPDGQLRLPALPDGLLLRVENGLHDGWPFPVDGSGEHTDYYGSNTFTFTNHDKNNLSTYFGDYSGAHPGVPGFRNAGLHLETDLADVQYRFEGGGERNASYTYVSHHPLWGSQFVITGRTTDGSLSGGLSLRRTDKLVPGTDPRQSVVEHHRSRFGWRFERNGSPGLPAREPEPEPESVGGYQSPPFLALEAASFPREPVPGLPVTMAFRVENVSQLPAARVSLDLTLADPRIERPPKDLEIIGDFCSPLDDGRFRCNLGDMKPGEVSDLVFTAETPMTGAVIWAADLASAGDLGGPVELGGLLGARGPPRIMDVVVIHDQTRVEHELPLYAYPYGPNAHGGDTRYLLVVGHNLPQRPAQNLTLTDTDTIHYSFLAFPDSNSQFYQEWFDKGWQRFYDMEDAAAARARAEEDGYDAVLVRADLKPGIMPGQRTITVSDAEDRWGLEFGDLSARLSFVRRLEGGGIDLLRNAYIPERIYLAVETNIALPLEEIPVFINAENLAGGQQGEIELIARRSELGNGRIYLAGPLDLHRRGRTPSLSGGTAIATSVERNDPGLLQARIDESFILKTFHLPLDPVVASVAVGVTPAAGDYSWLWRDGLSRAAACHDDVVIDDWGKLTQAESDEIWNLIILTTSDHFPGQSVTFGHHAAAVLLRDMFAFVMEKQIRKLEWIRSNRQALLGLMAYMKPRAWDDDLPLLRIPANDFSGLETEYRYIILNDTAWLAEENNTSEEAIEAWRERETVAALGKLIEAAGEAVEQARDAEDCEIEDLIRLTGFSFSPISRLLKAEFVTLAEVASSGGARALLWQPDMAARFWVDQVAPLAEAVRQQQIHANVDTDLTLAAVAFLTLPFILAEGTAVALVTFAIDLVDLAVTTVHELSQYFASEAELAFASGAAITIGEKRHQSALENAKGWASTAFGIGTSAFGAVMGGVDALPKLAVLRRVARGRQLARTMEGAGELASLRPVDLQDFGAFAMSSWMRAQEAGLEGLTAVERRALALVEEYKTLNTAAKIVPEPDVPPLNVIDSSVPTAPVRFDPDAQSGLATARPPPGGRIETPRTSGDVPNAFETRVPPETSVRFTDSSGSEVDLPLGDHLGAGYTSEVFAHADDADNLAIRITFYRENAPAAVLDQVGDTSLRTRVRSEHIRPVRIESSHVVSGVEFQGQAVTRVSVVERVPETAQRTIARQGGRMSIAQMMAYEGALRDLNRQGLVWLDNKWDNFAFVPANDGSGRVQVVVLDPGGIVPIRLDAGAATGESMAELARRIQMRVNGDFATQVPDYAFVEPPKWRTRLRQETLLDDFADAFDYQELGIPGPEHLLFNPKSGEDFDYIAPLFEAAE